MSVLAAALPSLGEMLGLDPAGLDGRDHLAVAIEGVGEIHAEGHDDRVLLSLARSIEVGADRLAVCRAALRAVHPDNLLAWPVQSALAGDALVFIAHLDAGEAARQELEAAFEMLITLQDTAAGGMHP